MNASVIELNESNFEQEVLGAAEAVLVEFWAAWSDPCKAMRPFLESLAEDRVGSIKVARVNVEQHEALAERCGARAVPTLLIFSQGRLRDQIVGRATEREIRKRLEAFRMNAASQTNSHHNQQSRRVNMQRRTNGQNGHDGKKQTFAFTAPSAMSVQLVGDFTHWQDQPINLRRDKGGVWRATVKLPPGAHRYRFLVDGQWRDDPECVLRESNPFGGHDSVLKIN